MFCSEILVVSIENKQKTKTLISIGFRV